MSKILVTGGAGFIGSNLVDELIKQGNEVVIIDDLSSGKQEFVNEKSKFYNLDICNFSEVEKVFANEKFNYVFHLAAQIDVRKSVEMPEFDNQVNAIGSLNIFKLSQKYKVKKVVFISTGGALYGDVKKPATEKTLIQPVSPYAIHKYTAERYLELLNETGKLKYTVLRLANVYGPRQYKGGEGAVVAVFTYNGLHDQESTINGDGLQTRDYVYVGDIVEACIAALDSKKNNVFNIGSSIESTVLDTVTAINKALGKQIKVVHGPAKPGEVRKSVLNSAKALKKLNWSAKVNLEEGIKKTIAWVNSLNDGK